MSLNILLAEDEDEARLLLRAGLEHRGHQVRVAADGKAALALALQQEPQIVVTDLLMPGGDGLTLLQGLRQAGLSSLVIVATAHADKDAAIALLNAGADYLVEKPFTAAELGCLIEDLQQRREQREDDVLTAAVTRRLDALPLNAGDRKLVTLILKGASNRRIAQILGIQEQTVKNRLLEIYRTLGVSSRTELLHLLVPL